MTPENIHRRDFLKNLGLLVGGSIILPITSCFSDNTPNKLGTIKIGGGEQEVNTKYKDIKVFHTLKQHDDSTYTYSVCGYGNKQLHEAITNTARNNLEQMLYNKGAYNIRPEVAIGIGRLDGHAEVSPGVYTMRYTVSFKINYQKKERIQKILTSGSMSYDSHNPAKSLFYHPSKEIERKSLFVPYQKNGHRIYEKPLLEQEIQEGKQYIGICEQWYIVVK